MLELEAALRWIHVVAGIMWIGHLWFFNFVNSAFAPTMDGETKKKVVPQLMPRALFWFRWGAAWTWITGVLLLGLVFHMAKSTMFEGFPLNTWSAAPNLLLGRYAPFAMALCTPRSRVARRTIFDVSP